MWAKVEGASITELIPRPKAMTIGDTQYPRNIFDLWGAAELRGIGIYEITVDYTNLKDKDYYQNTDITYTWDSENETVTGAYGTATAKDLADTTSTVNGKESTVLGLKSIHKSRIDAEAGGILSKHDWMLIREAEGGTAIPSNIKTWRASIRTKANSMCTQIDGAANVDALAALFTYTGNPATRPLGEWPSEPS